MTPVRVIAAQGVTLRGPCRLSLTAAQHARRVHVFGKKSRTGVYTVDGGAAVSFKYGETFGYDGPQGMLHSDQFERVVADEDPEVAAADPVA